MIRAAELSDVPRLVALGRLFHEESGYGPDMPLVERDLAVYLRRMIRDKGAFLLVLVGEDGGIRAALGVATVRAFFNFSVLMGTEQFFFSDRVHRNKGVGRRLLQAAKARARELGYTVLCMVELEYLRDGRVAELYESEGLRPAERSYVIRL